MIIISEFSYQNRFKIISHSDTFVKKKSLIFFWRRYLRPRKCTVNQIVHKGCPSHLLHKKLKSTECIVQNYAFVPCFSQYVLYD